MSTSLLIYILRHSNRQQVILTKFYTNNAPFIGNQTAKF